MSTLNSTDGHPGSGLHGARDRTSPDQGGDEVLSRMQGGRRATRRRSDPLRLREPTDDGFHLFRVY